MDAPEPHGTGRRHRLVLGLAIALPVALVIGVIIAAVIATRTPERRPVALGPVPAPAAQGPECAALMSALPNDLGDYSAAELASPAPPATKAWERGDGGDPVVLRCGLDRPAEFNVASPLQGVDGVQWLQISDHKMHASTWYVVDRGVYLALTLPDGTGPTPIQAVSDTVAKVLPAKPIRPGPLPK